MLFWTPYFSVLDSTFSFWTPHFGWTPRLNRLWACLPSFKQEVQVPQGANGTRISNRLIADARYESYVMRVTQILSAQWSSFKSRGSVVGPVVSYRKLPVAQFGHLAHFVITYLRIFGVPKTLATPDPAHLVLV